MFDLTCHEIIFNESIKIAPAFLLSTSLNIIAWQVGYAEPPVYPPLVADMPRLATDDFLGQLAPCFLTVGDLNGHRRCWGAQACTLGVDLLRTRHYATPSPSRA